MRIGQDDCFLSLERVDPELPYSPFRVTAHVEDCGIRFGCLHDRVMFDMSDKTSRVLLEFQELKVHFAEITASEDGWLRLSRNAHGQIAVRYRVGNWRLVAAMEGEVTVDGDFADRFCNELRAVLRNSQ